jgi:hypothetical protein
MLKNFTPQTFGMIHKGQLSTVRFFGIKLKAYDKFENNKAL